MPHLQHGELNNTKYEADEMCKSGRRVFAFLREFIVNPVMCALLNGIHFLKIDTRNCNCSISLHSYCNITSRLLIYVFTNAS